MSAPTHEIAVVGAGIVGACIAHALVARGHAVALLDHAGPGMGCSFGNAGALSSASVAPLAMPGVVRSTPALLRDPEGPLYLPPAYLPRALPWLVRFVASATPRRVESTARELAALNAGAADKHAALARVIGAPELVQRTGHLYVYPDDAAFAQDAATWALRARHGARVERLDRAALLALEPALGPRYHVGVHLAEHATVVNPLRYVQRIVADFRTRGGTFVQRGVRSIGIGDAELVLRLDAGERRCARVVIAAGAWSNALLRPLGHAIPLETQRGYHASFSGVASPITRVVVLADRKAFVTPMETGLRIAGTVEFGGLERPPDWRRADLLARFARETFPCLAHAATTQWMGHRPCMPDSRPRIGPVDAARRLWVATGHGHLGLTQAVATAERIAHGFDEHLR